VFKKLRNYYQPHLTLKNSLPVGKTLLFQKHTHTPPKKRG